MKRKVSTPYAIKSITELHRLFALQKPDHPLMSVIDFNRLSYAHSDIWTRFYNDFYCITLKKGSNGQLKYGQHDYDFGEGMMSFTRPGQVFSVTRTTNTTVEGFMLVFKADLIRPYALGKEISKYGFFSYSIAEALHLSEKEDHMISGLFRQMQDELKNNIDAYSQDVLVSQIELLLHYADRFYNRQFLTRRAVNNDLIEQLDTFLENYFQSTSSLHAGIPSVQLVASELHLSSNYLSDLVRNATGRNAQQYIQDHLIEKAKLLLTTSSLSIGEIAYQLGFGYTQSFNKLFKRATNQTPLTFRRSFN